MKRENPIEEIWRIRGRLGAEEGYDVHRLFERLRQEAEPKERDLRAGPFGSPASGEPMGSSPPSFPASYVCPSVFGCGFG